MFRTNRRPLQYLLLAVISLSAMGVQASWFGGNSQCKRVQIADVSDLTMTEAAGELGLNTLLAVAGPLGVGDLLDQSNNITLFAPTDEAFDALLAGVAPASDDVVAAILSYHVVPRKFDPRRVAYIRKVPTLLGQDLFVSRGKKAPDVNQSNIECQGYRTKNGLVWVVDSVLVPQFFAE
jgi:uncharacterized surface protein with fasciclin (FAS1) repeats